MREIEPYSVDAIYQTLCNGIFKDNRDIINSIDCFINHYDEYNKQQTIVWLNAIKSQLTRINDRLINIS